MSAEDRKAVASAAKTYEESKIEYVTVKTGESRYVIFAVHPREPSL